MSDLLPDNPKQHPTSNAVKDPDDWVTGDEQMTGAQASYLQTLSEEAGEPGPETGLPDAPGGDGEEGEDQDDDEGPSCGEGVECDEAASAEAGSSAKNAEHATVDNSLTGGRCDGRRRASGRAGCSPPAAPRPGIRATR